MTESIDDLADILLDGGAVDSEDVPAIPSKTDGSQSALEGLAFTVWALEAGRDMKETQRIIAQRTGITVSVYQLRQWRKAGDWAVNSSSVNQAFIGRISADTVRPLGAMSTVKAARSLIRVLDNPTMPGANTLLKAIGIAFDRFGYPILMRGELFNGVTVAVDDGLSDEDLEATWSSYDRDSIPPDDMDGRHGDMQGLKQLHHNELRAADRIPSPTPFAS